MGRIKFKVKNWQGTGETLEFSVLDSKELYKLYKQRNRKGRRDE